jgi:predicted membrane protein
MLLSLLLVFVICLLFFELFLFALLGFKRFAKIAGGVICASIALLLLYIVSFVDPILIVSLLIASVVCRWLYAATKTECTRKAAVVALVLGIVLSASSVIGSAVSTIRSYGERNDFHGDYYLYGDYHLPDDSYLPDDARILDLSMSLDIPDFDEYHHYTIVKGRGADAILYEQTVIH